MESPNPDSGSSGHLSKEQLLEYLKKQRAKIKSLEARLEAQQAPKEEEKGDATLHLCNSSTIF